MLKNISKYLKKLNNDLKKYQDNITYGLDYIFNELNEEDYYEAKKLSSVFDGSYILYESKGNKLTLWEYFNKIRAYLRDMIDDHKAKGKWKIQLVMRIILLGTHRHAYLYYYLIAYVTT